MNPVKVEITGVSSLKGKLNTLAYKYGPDHPVVVVGFTQAYALYVHEINASHKVGQWKYLETPARQLATVIANIVVKLIKQGVSLEQALLVGGLRLQREAQKLTPVDTSALKASAFTSTEAKLEEASKHAFEVSEKIRKSKKGSGP